MDRTKTALLASISAVALTAAASPMIAVAETPTPSAGNQTGSGSTDVYVQLAIDPDVEEYGGGGTPENPDVDPEDGLGDNVAFTVPSSINFVADVNGVLTGPSASAAYIQNLSTFGIHVSSFDVDEENGWTIIEDGTNATANNSVDFQFGPTADTLDAYDYLTKAAVGTPTAWNMNSNATVGMASSGNIFKVTKDITSANKIATIKTYVKPKLATS